VMVSSNNGIGVSCADEVQSSGMTVSKWRNASTVLVYHAGQRISNASELDSIFDVAFTFEAPKGVPLDAQIRMGSVDERSSSATAAGKARSAATIADKLSEPSDCPAGRRFAAAHWLGDMVSGSLISVCHLRARPSPAHLQPSTCPANRA
jgi:hypothetical protein